MVVGRVGQKNAACGKATRGGPGGTPDPDIPYRAIFETTGTATTIVEADMTLSLVNREFEILSGYRREEIEGRMLLSDFVDAADRERIGRYHRLRRRTPSEAPRNYQFRFRNRQGRIRNILMTIDMVRGTGQSVASMLDVTEQRRTLIALKEAEQEARIGRLAMAAAHALRTPLTSLKLRLYALNRRYAGVLDESDEDIEAMGDEVQRIEKIIRDYFEFSRPLALEKEWVSVSTLVDHALERCLHQCLACQVEARVKRSGRLPEVSADRERLLEAFVNLIVNACEAMKGGGRLEIREFPDRRLRGKRAVAVRISDTGPGIPAGNRDRIYQPFFSTKEDGIGLGLSITRQIVEEHGGRIAVRTSEAGGAVFTVTLPAPEEVA